MDKMYSNKLTIALLLLPAVILFLGIIIVPIIMSTYYSFFDWNGITDMKFIAFDNYKELFTSKTINFKQSLLNVSLLAVLSVCIQLPISFGLALLLGKGIKGERLFLSIYFFPVLISTVVIGQLWLKIYNSDYGVLNVAIRALGFKDFEQSWLGDRKVALGACVVPILWQYVGYHMLLLYAGVKGIPQDLRESAMIDGASEWQVNRHIVMPLVKPVLQVSVIFAVTGSLKAFDLIYVLTRGGPAHATEVPSTLMISMLFTRMRYGMGSAIATILIILCFAFAIIIKKVFRTEETDAKSIRKAKASKE